MLSLRDKIGKHYYKILIFPTSAWHNSPRSEQPCSSQWELRGCLVPVCSRCKTLLVHTRDFHFVSSPGRCKHRARRGHSSGTIIPALGWGAVTHYLPWEGQAGPGSGSSAQGGKLEVFPSCSLCPDLKFWTLQLLHVGSQIRKLQIPLAGFLFPLLPGCSERCCTSDRLFIVKDCEGLNVFNPVML